MENDPPDDADARGTIDLVGHVIVPARELDPLLTPVSNVIVTARTSTGAWIEAISRLIGPARARFRSTYFQWAMAINGLFLAADRYAQKDFNAKKQFIITGFRYDNETNKHTQVNLAEWRGEKAASAHRATIPKMAAWGYIEMFAVLEKFVFEMYREFLGHRPDTIIEGPDFAALRRLRREAENDKAKQDEWEKAWAARLDAWHRKRLYDSLHKVFRAFFAVSGLREPKRFTKTTVDSWAESIEGIALVRHLLVHGEDTVPEPLERFCGKPHNLGFNFKAGSPLRVDLVHLQSVETFCHELLNALNESLVEHPDALK